MSLCSRRPKLLRGWRSSSFGRSREGISIRARCEFSLFSFPFLHLSFPLPLPLPISRSLSSFLPRTDSSFPSLFHLCSLLQSFLASPSSHVADLILLVRGTEAECKSHREWISDQERKIEEVGKHTSTAKTVCLTEAKCTSSLWLLLPREGEVERGVRRRLSFFSDAFRLLSFSSIFADVSRSRKAQGLPL